MKKYIVILILFITSLNSYGQRKHNKETREKIKSLKVAFLSQKLELSPDEAEKFWPSYNKHEAKKDLLKNKGREEYKKIFRQKDNSKIISETEAKNFVLFKLDSEKKILAENEEFVLELSKFLSYKKIIKLHTLEREFSRELMKKYYKGRKRNK